MVTLLMSGVPSIWDAISFSIVQVAFTGVFTRVQFAQLEDPVLLNRLLNDRGLILVHLHLRVYSPRVVFCRASLISGLALLRRRELCVITDVLPPTGREAQLPARQVNFKEKLWPLFLTKETFRIIEKPPFLWSALLMWHFQILLKAATSIDWT